MARPAPGMRFRPRGAFCRPHPASLSGPIAQVNRPGCLRRARRSRTFSRGTLSCVILVKLPFWPPSLPLIEARSEFLKSLGRDPFQELLLPEAVIRFKQGFGRLIRSKGDRGVVILLDDRVIEKYYGRFFLNSLPIHTHIRGENSLILRKIEEWRAMELD